MASPYKAAAGWKRANPTRPGGGKRGRGYVRTNRPRYSGFAAASRAAIAGELKFHDVDVDDVSIAQNGVIQNTGSVNLIAQGVTESTRVGRKCVVKQILWRYEIQKFAATSETSSDEVVRVILYVDKQTNGLTATVTDILETDDYQSFRNLTNSGRFKFLMDKTFSVNALAAGGDGTSIEIAERTMNFQFFKSCNIPLEFSAGAGALTEIRSNNIGVLLLSRQGAAAGFVSKLRLRFSDGS